MTPAKTEKRIRTKKKILSVTIRRMVDTSPDTSHLGEYSSRSTSQFSIDRAHAEDCIENDSPQKEKLNRIADAIENDRSICEEHTHTSEPHCEVCTEELAYTSAMDAVRELAECDCGERGDMGRGEFRYFNPSFNYVTKTDDPADGLTPEEVRTYTRQDYERMESMNRGNWCYIGIRAEAEVIVNVETETHRLGTEGPGKWRGVVQRITSGGLWGIESDSERSYIEEEQKNQLADLKSELLALGFSKRAIATAFKNTEEKDE